MTGALVVLPTQAVRAVVVVVVSRPVTVVQNFAYEAIVARGDKVTLVDGWIVPPGPCAKIPEAIVHRARAVVDAGDGFQLVGHDGNAVDQAADHIRRLLRMDVAP